VKKDFEKIFKSSVKLNFINGKALLFEANEEYNRKIAMMFGVGYATTGAFALLSAHFLSDSRYILFFLTFFPSFLYAHNITKNIFYHRILINKLELTDDGKSLIVIPKFRE
jgi:hypothetical protein